MCEINFQAHISKLGASNTLGTLESSISESPRKVSSLKSDGGYNSPSPTATDYELPPLEVMAPGREDNKQEQIGRYEKNEYPEEQQGYPNQQQAFPNQQQGSPGGTQARAGKAWIPSGSHARGPVGTLIHHNEINGSKGPTGGGTQSRGLRIGDTYSSPVATTPNGAVLADMGIPSRSTRREMYSHKMGEVADVGDDFTGTGSRM